MYRRKFSNITVYQESFTKENIGDFANFGAFVNVFLYYFLYHFHFVVLITKFANIFSQTP